MLDPSATDAAAESTARSIDPVWLHEWLTDLHREQTQQTKYLRNISGWVTLVGVLVLIGLVISALSAFSPA